MNMTLKRKQQGFTLLELVIVIVIIGILAAIAVPKFTSLSADARLGALKGVQGALAGANVSIYSAAQSQNKAGSSGLNITACGVTNISAVYGYAADLAELQKCVTITPADDFTPSPMTGTTVAHKGASTAANCQISYVAATVSSPPQYNLPASPDCS